MKVLNGNNVRPFLFSFFCCTLGRVTLPYKSTSDIYIYYIKGQKSWSYRFSPTEKILSIRPWHGLPRVQQTITSNRLDEIELQPITPD